MRKKVEKKKTISGWKFPPGIKSVFYDDFSSGIRTDVWRALNEKWQSQKNNGYSNDNCMFTVNPEKVKAEGATGGLVIIRSNGDFSEDAERKRQGGGLVTKRLFGAGLYEVRLKVVPRVGQCSAAWTYYNNWSPTYEEREYSEIDIEAPHGGDYRKYSGTTYKNYMSYDRRESRSEVIPTTPLNDGKWHVMAFEWRTDEKNGDVGVVWYQDGKPVLRITQAVPRYTATFWVGTLFQDAIAWLGDPQFETAYMYVDWVRITEYDDPVSDGNAEKENKLTFCGNPLGDLPVPHNNYIANSRFTQPATVKNYKGREICSWNLSGDASIENNRLVFNGEGQADQIITAQYENYCFEIECEATVENGEVCVGLEFLKGQANCENPEFIKTGECPNVMKLTKETSVCKMRFTVTEKETEHVRVKIYAENGVKAYVHGIKMTLVD